VSYVVAGINPTIARRGVSKAAFVYEHLRSAIIGLALEPGARLDKAAICEQLGVSRQPLAEAVTRLADDGLVEVEPQKGTFVARIRLSDVAEAAFLRRSLEVGTVEAIAPGVDDHLVERLERNLAYQTAAVKARDVEEFYAFDVRFHTMLFDRLGMRRVAEAVEVSRAQLERTRRLLLPTPKRNQNSLVEHRAILTALAERNPRKAADAMGAHLDEGMQQLRTFAGEQPELFEP
jgi:GntR family transcriptional regulator, rspAB operon transcriptional repressor